MRNNLKGFTLVEILMVISLVAILGGVAISNFDNSLDEAKFDATYKEMLQIRKALIGDLENTTIEGERIRFGYLGDMGGIPTTSQGLAAIYSQPVSASAWAVNSDANVGVGWNGPYIVSSTDEDYFKDAWGRDYIYVSSTSVPYVLSYGADGVEGGTGSDTDIQMDIPLSIRSATVNGQIVSSGSVYTGSAYIEMYYPTSSGGLTSQAVTLSSGNSGQFTFSSIPFGIRSVKIKIPSSVSPILTIGPVTFAVDNQNYFMQSNLLEVNPTVADANCNTISNVSYVTDSLVLDDTNNIDRASFQLNINRSFSINNLAISHDGNGNSQKLEKIGIGGIVYGCFGTVSNLVSGTVDRGIVECNGSNKEVSISSNPTLTLNNAWGIPSGTAIQAFVDFKGGVTAVNSIILRLGCDTMTIACSTYYTNGTKRQCTPP